MLALSTCWNASRHTDGKAMLEEVRSLGFEYAELGHNTSIALLPGVQAAVKAGVIKVASLHNFCPLPVGITGMAPDCYVPSALDDRERDQALRHTLRTLEFAASVGATVVVLHLGYIPMHWPNRPRRLMAMYAEGQERTPAFEQLRQKTLLARERKRKKHFAQVCRVLDRLVPRVKELKLKLGMETRMCVHEIPSEDEADSLIRCYGEDALTYWFDNAHGQIRENMGLLQQEAVLERFRGRMAGMHLQDFAPPLLDHMPAGAGEYRFERLTPFLNDGMIVSWEIHGQWEPQMIADGARRVHALLRRPPA
ncbi:MAG: TIM barrel protein [Verrucomicrobia bacterium]|nr:TIM barrel protein [Verrucomicrobiota bacterium]